MGYLAVYFQKMLIRIATARQKPGKDKCIFKVREKLVKISGQRNNKFHLEVGEKSKFVFGQTPGFTFMKGFYTLSRKHKHDSHVCRLL